jgi:hypothetical protein
VEEKVWHCELVLLGLSRRLETYFSGTEAEVLGRDIEAVLLLVKKISLLTMRTVPPSHWALLREAWDTSSLVRYLDGWREEEYG